MFDQLSEKFLKVIRDLQGKGTLTEENMEVALRQVRLNLLEADVHYQVVKSFVDHIRQKAIGQEVLKSLTPGQAVVKIIYDEMRTMLGSQVQHLNLSTKPPVVIMVVGLQGSGKTTTCAKLAYHLKGKGRKPFLVPADVQRPAAIEQLHQLAKKIGVEAYPTKPNDQPVRICEKSIQQALASACDTVLIDTAGRLHVDEDLMKELKKMVQVVIPQEILLVADAMTGQDAVHIAKEFDAALDLTGVILTKMEGNARAGAAFSMKMVTGKPIKFIGVGEGVQALEVFYPDRIASRILDMGDIVSLVEKAQESVNQEEAQALLQKIQKREFSIEDFRKHLQQMKKIGSMESWMGLLPGMKKLKGKIDFQEAESELVKKQAIIDSMTRAERCNHRILNGSRRQRIAAGSGTRVQDVNQFVREFTQMQTLMHRFGKMGMKGLGGILKGLGS